jgi:hypothetical protein
MSGEIRRGKIWCGVVRSAMVWLKPSQFPNSKDCAFPGVIVCRGSSGVPCVNSSTKETKGAANTVMLL